MATNRTLLLFLSGALLLGVSIAAAPSVDLFQEQNAAPEQPVVQPQEVYPHHPVLQLADPATRQIHSFELDGRVVEAVILAPASAGRILLKERVDRMNPEWWGRKIDVDLFRYVMTETVPARVIVPVRAFASELTGAGVKAVSGQLLDARDTLTVGTVLPMGTEALWWQGLEGEPTRVTIRDQRNQEFTGRAIVYTENIRVGRLISGPTAHNPQGSDECIKISTCDLICDEGEQ